LRIATGDGELIATHRPAPAGAGQRIRTATHAAGLQGAVLAAFTTKAPCRKKQNRPPGERALAELAALHGHDRAPAVSLEQYAELAEAVYELDDLAQREIKERQEQQCPPRLDDGQATLADGRIESSSNPPRSGLRTPQA